MTGVVVAEMGHRIYFTTAIEMVRRLTKAMKENRLSREVRNLLRPKLLIIDEVGYLTLDRAQASLLFQIVAQRYEREQPLILTSNKAFAHWDLRRRPDHGFGRARPPAAPIGSHQHPRRQLPPQG